jgi:nitrogen-specific signal transduction histidine kinase
VRVAPLLSSSAQEDTLVMVAEDVSESRQLEEQMMRSERLASIGTMTAGIAHQIGNHLNGIQGYAQLLTRSTIGVPSLSSTTRSRRGRS